jgi:chromosome segregation ATPase
MAAKKPTERNTKAEILEAFDEVAKEKAELKAQLDRLSKENQVLEKQTATKDTTNPQPKTIMDRSQSLQQQMNNTIEGLAKIQLGFGSAVSNLSEQLTTQATGLQEIRSAVATEIEQLKKLHSLKLADNTLDTLIKSYDDNSKTFAEELERRCEALDLEVGEQRKAWEREQEEHKRTIKDRNETLNKTKQRETAEYKYNLELQRKLNNEEYEQSQKLLHKELEESIEQQEKQWAEREKAIADREQQYAEYKAKLEALPKEKETALKKATEEGKGIGHYQTKVQADLYAKEVEGQKRFYEQRWQSLEQTIQNNETRIQNLAKQLESALKQVQDLAVKAIEGAANVSSYQAVKEIALEQAKNQLKNK